MAAARRPVENPTRRQAGVRRVSKTFTLDAHQPGWIDAAAKAQEITPSEFMRRLIHEAIVKADKATQRETAARRKMKN